MLGCIRWFSRSGRGMLRGRLGHPAAHRELWSAQGGLVPRSCVHCAHEQLKQQAGLAAHCLSSRASRRPRSQEAHRSRQRVTGFSLSNVAGAVGSASCVRLRRVEAGLGSGRRAQQAQLAQQARQSQLAQQAQQETEGGIQKLGERIWENWETEVGRQKLGDKSWKAVIGQSPGGPARQVIGSDGGGPCRSACHRTDAPETATPGRAGHRAVRSRGRACHRAVVTPPARHVIGR